MLTGSLGVGSVKYSEVFWKEKARIFLGRTIPYTTLTKISHNI